MYYTKRTAAKINLDNLIFNAKSYKTAIGGKASLMCVVKADAYGHGVRAVTKCLQNDLNINWFAVSNISEAIELRENQINGNILILGYTDPAEADALIKYDIIQACVDLNYAEELNSHVTSGMVRVHIKLDTGMTRIGIPCDNISDAVRDAEKIYSLGKLKVEGIFTHLCVADSDSLDNKAYTEAQISKIKEVKRILNEDGYETGICHWLNSAGGIYTSHKDSDLARLGIILYGLCPNHALKVPIEMKPVLELVSTVSMVKNIKPGTYIGYGRTFCAETNMKIATVTVGYADGYPRLLSNRGEVIIGGKRCKIVGNVCMDQITVDVTDVDVSTGDEVVLIGKRSGKEITADDIADLCGTIGYEITCGISKRVPRIIIKNAEQVEIH